MKRAGLLLVVSLVLAGAALAQSEETVTVPGRHRLSILVPAGYSFQVERDMDNNAAVRMDNPVWPIAITAYIISESDPAVTSTEWQRNQLISRVAPALPQAKEDDYNILPLRSSSGQGVYCVFTDATYKKPEELPVGEFLHLTGGVKVWRGCYVYFQIMSNDVTSPEYREAFELFETSFTK